MLKGICNFVRSIFDGRRFENHPFAKAFFAKQRSYLIGAVLCVFFFLLFFSTNAPGLICFVPVLLAFVFTYWYVTSNNRMLQDMSALLAQVQAIADGTLTATAALSPSSPLAATAEKLSGIGGGLQKSLEKQIRGERMKIELVTNVSHDLKTPLTSIISYVDLLQKEDLSPAARDYVAILAQKSDRLKHIVADLFDLAKSTSGNLDLQFEVLDFRRLTEQTLADLQEEIDRSGLIFRTALGDAPLYIKSDGRKLYRVLQNVIDNALKYSLPGTRVFVELVKVNERAVLTFKNTAGYEMTFSTEEIMERFTRGDKARTSDGSGLGLSIAQSFTAACGGRFFVAVDGDQFKAHISFALCAAPSPAEAASEPADSACAAESSPSE